MTTSDHTARLNHFGSLIETRIGLAIHRQNPMLLEDILVQMAGDNVPDYLLQLKQAAIADAIWQDLIRELTLGETYFLRDETHFNVLKQEVFPELIRQRRQQGEHKLNIWSAGCATGEEPYSIAIVLYEILHDVDRWEVSILGTDINAYALQSAQTAVYREWALRHTSHDFRWRYFRAAPDGWQLRHDIKGLVRFRQHNLLTEPPVQAADLILCRNVLLYFGTEQTIHVERQLAGTLKPNGWLLLGQAENLHTPNIDLSPFRPEYPAMYRRPSVTKSQSSRQDGARTPSPQAEYQPDVEAAYQQAVEALQNEDTATAKRLIGTVLTQYPEHPRALVVQAGILAGQCQNEAAHTAIDTALERDPLLADGYYLRALLYMEADDTQKASRALRSALYCQPSHALAAFILGNLYLQNGSVRTAAHYWRNARHAIHALPASRPVSAISDMTAGQLHVLITEQLKGWNADTC